jgi:isochorismate synthase
MPLEESRRFILENESEPRAYYAGFIGPVNMPPSKETEGLSTDIFVNIRCMKLENGFAKLYAGVGLTADSDIDKEWEETEAKFDTLARFL